MSILRMRQAVSAAADSGFAITAGNMTLSNGNCTATQTSPTGAARGGVGHVSGKRYFELYIDSFGSGASYISYYGVQSGGATLSSSINSSSANVTIRGNGGMYYNGVDYYGAASSGLNAGDVLGVAVEVGSNIKFYRNNSLIGSVNYAVSDPRPYFATTSSTNNSIVTLRTTAASLSYSPPSGYTAWE